MGEPGVTAAGETNGRHSISSPLVKYKYNCRYLLMTFRKRIHKKKFGKNGNHTLQGTMSHRPLTNTSSLKITAAYWTVCVPQSTYIPRVPQCLCPRPNWDSPNPSPASARVAPPPGTKGRETHSPGCEGVGTESQFGRLEKKLSTLSTLWCVRTVSERKPKKYLLTINVPLFKKLRDIIFFWWDNHFMSHFEGHFEGAKTFLTP